MLYSMKNILYFIFIALALYGLTYAITTYNERMHAYALHSCVITHTDKQDCI